MRRAHEESWKRKEQREERAEGAIAGGPQHLSVPCRGTDEEHNVSTYYETALEVAIFHAGYLRS